MSVLSLTVDRLYPYGPEAGDVKITGMSSVTGERLSPLITVPHGLPVIGGQLMNTVFVSIISNKAINTLTTRIYLFEPKHLLLLHL